MENRSLEISRRAFVRFAGASTCALTFGGFDRTAIATGATLDFQPIRACIFLFYYGGPSHIDTYDMKPDAPVEVRGDFQSISTKVPGLRICEHLPRMAQVMDKVAIVRSMHHSSTLHDSASIHALTGRPLEGADRELFEPIPQFYPSYGSAVTYMKPNSTSQVPYAALPFVFQNVIPTPCQGGGFLGNAWDPLRIDVDPDAKRYLVDSLGLRDGVNLTRMLDRRDLLTRLNASNPNADSMRRFHDRALQLIESESIRTAMDITREPDSVRQRYGFGAAPADKGEVNGGGGEMGFARQMRGQNLLLARRLVEAGVQFINIYDCKQQGQNWDAHANGSNQHKSFLLPQADQALSALIEDLEQRGLLESTLIVATGEFGRTPKINATAGRDHWPHCYSLLMAGGGVHGGAIYGSSDKHGAYPATDPVTPGDIAATIYWRFGIDHAAEIHDPLGRPHRLAIGEPLRKLFG
jgi:hypothetical protein